MKIMSLPTNQKRGFILRGSKFHIAKRIIVDCTQQRMEITVIKIHLILLKNWGVKN